MPSERDKIFHLVSFLFQKSIQGGNKMNKAKEDLFREMQEGILDEEKRGQELEKTLRGKNLNLINLPKTNIDLPKINYKGLQRNKAMDGFSNLPKKLATADLKKKCSEMT